MKILKLTAVLILTILILSSCTSLSDEAESESYDSTKVDETQPVMADTDTESCSESEVIPETTELADPEYSGNIYKPKAMMYHLVMENPYNDYTALFVRPSEFSYHLNTLNEAGYEYLFADDWHETKRPSVILTFDDGYEDNYTNMFPILKKYSAKATIFLISDFIGSDGYLNEAQIKEMSDSGLVSFQSHTVRHLDLSNQNEGTLTSEFSDSIKKIEEITGKPVKSLAYPAGSFNDTVINIASDYFNFCYTTKSPVSTKEYTNYTIPRYYIARELTHAQFENYISYE